MNANAVGQIDVGDGLVLEPRRQLLGGQAGGRHEGGQHRDCDACKKRNPLATLYVPVPRTIAARAPLHPIRTLY